MLYTINELKNFSAYQMLKKTQFSEVSLSELNGIPVAIKKYNSKKLFDRYDNEKKILLSLNGKFRTPQLLSYDDENLILYIEWIAGDRLKEYLIKKYLNKNDEQSFRDPEIVKKAQVMFKKDKSFDAIQIKNQIFSIVRLISGLGICHSDINVRNIIINPRGIVYLFDFSNGRFDNRSTQDKKIINHKLGINYFLFFIKNRSILKEKHYQSCNYPNGIISSGDGQGDTYRKFNYLGIKDLSELSFMDIACAEGEVCRNAFKKGSNEVLGIDISKDALRRGRHVNSLFNYSSINLEECDFFNLNKLLNGKTFDVVTCFSLLHHLLPVPDPKKYRDLLKVVTYPELKESRFFLIKAINYILEITNYVFFLELPFEFDGFSKRDLNTGKLFLDNISNEINGEINYLGNWHSNNKKIRFIYRIDKKNFTNEMKDKILYNNPILSAWRNFIHKL
jgi:SAM-dependent methyltransferase/tRNA A-37 threonylcarbamoyl transferase component Bud32